MVWSPVTGLPIQYSEDASGTAASGHYLKFYASGTTTPINMATDSTGATTLAKCQLNSLGQAINGSSAVFIPHIDQKYKAVLYPDDTTADANTFASAIWNVDGITPQGVDALNSVRASGEFVKEFATMAAAIASTTLVEGDVILVKDRANSHWDVVLSSGVTENSYDVVQCVGVGTLSFVLRVYSGISIYAFGDVGGGVNDDRAVFVAALAALTAIGGGILECPEGDYWLDPDGANGYSILMPSNITIKMHGIGVTRFKARTADGAYQLFRCGGTHGTRTNIHFIGGATMDMNCTGTPVDNGAEAIRFSNCTNFSAPGIRVTNANGAGVRADGYGTSGVNTNWYKSAPNYATQWGQSSDFNLDYIQTDNCYLGVEIEGGAKRGSVKHGYHTDVVAHGVRLTSADTVDVEHNVTDGCTTGVWVDESYSCNIRKNLTLNYSDHAIAVAFLEGGSICDNEDDGSGVLGTNHAITDSYQYVEANYTGVGLGAGSLRNVLIENNKSTNRIFIQHGKDLNIGFNQAGLDVMRDQNARINILHNKGSFVESGLDYTSVRLGERHKQLTLTGASGTFTAAETVTGGTSGATGVVVSYSGDKLKIRVRKGTFQAAETVTGGSSAATGTISAISTARVMALHQTNSDDTVSRFSMIQGPTCSAYVLFKGDGSVGDCDIYDSFNVNRVEKTATGSYKIYFVIPFVNAETIGLIATQAGAISNQQSTTTASSTILLTYNSSGVATDVTRATATIYGELDS